MKVVLACIACIILASPLSAMNVPISGDGSFTVQGPADSFTNWAVSNGATNNGFQTINNGNVTANEYMSGAATPSASATLTIPFSFPQPVTTAVLNYGAVCCSYGSNMGYVKVWVTVNGVDTLIFNGNSDATAAPYNYTSSQTPPDPMNWWTGYTDITGIVAGQTSFSVKIQSQLGWSSFLYNGGMFLPDNWPGYSDFRLTGTVTVPVATLVTQAQSYLASIGATSQTYAVGAAPEMSRIWRDSAPALTWGGPVSISLARGETEVAQLAVVPVSGGLQNVSASASALAHPGVQTSPIITVGPVGYVQSSVNNVTKAVPDVILSPALFNVSAGQLQAVYIQVDTDSTTVAGDYTGTVTIQPSGGATTQIPVTVHVWDFVLPQQPPLHGWVNTLAFSMLAKNKIEVGWWNPPFSDISHVTTGQWAAVESSLASWFSSGHSYAMICTPGCNMSGEQVGGSADGAMPVYTQAQINAMISYWQNIAAILSRLGKLNLAGIYVWDEPAPNNYANVVQISSWVHQADPRLKTVAAVNGDMRSYRDNGILNVYCPLLNLYNPTLDRSPAIGAEPWWYVCIIPGAPYPNLMVNNAPAEQRAIGWETWQMGPVGFLYWESEASYWAGTTSYTAPSTDCGTVANSGDGTLVYDLNGGWLSSLRLRNFADGLEDYQYIQILSNLVATLDLFKPTLTDPQWVSIRQNAASALSQVSSVTGASASAFTRDPNVILSARSAIANAIIQMQSIVSQLDSTPPSVPVVTVDKSPFCQQFDALNISWASSDPETGVAEYQYAVGTTPGGSDRSAGWLSTGTTTSVTREDLTQNPTDSFYFSVKAKNGCGMWSSPGSAQIIVAPNLVMANARNNPDTTNVSVSGVVTVGTDELTYTAYVESLDRTSGMKLSTSASFRKGDLVTLSGPLQTTQGERCLADPTEILYAPGYTVPSPLGMIGRSIGGSQPNSYTAGVYGSSGLYNVGLYVTTTGVVSALDTAKKTFYIDDGSGRTDPSNNLGIRVSYSGLTATNTITPPSNGSYVKVTGIVSTTSLSGQIIPMLRLCRSQGLVTLH